MYTFSKNGHWNLIVGLIHWLCTMEPDITYNAGMMRPFKVHGNSRVRQVSGRH